MKRTTELKRTTPLPRKRKGKPRRTTSPRCTIRGCKRRAEIDDWCVFHAEPRVDAMFSVWVRERDRVCTGARPLPSTRCTSDLQAAHGVGRTNRTTRFDPRNVHALCSAHHQLVDQNGREGHKKVWLVDRLGLEEYDRLMSESVATTDRRLAIQAALDWLREETA